MSGARVQLAFPSGLCPICHPWGARLRSMAVGLVLGGLLALGGCASVDAKSDAAAAPVELHVKPGPFPHPFAERSSRRVTTTDAAGVTTTDEGCCEGEHCRPPSR